MTQENWLKTVPTINGNGMTKDRMKYKATFIENMDFRAPIDTLSVFARRTHKIIFSSDDNGMISFVNDCSLQEESYKIESTKQGIFISASDNSGFQNGVITVIQLMEKADDHSFTFPIGSIIDKPDCKWRGIMIDLARDFHDFSMLLEYIDLCRFYKLHTLHLHFSDDDCYTLPSKTFPKLPNDNEHYTEEQIRLLNEYASLRGIEIMPEIDLPGHSTRLRQIYPDVFGNHGIICLGDDSISGVDALIREVIALFPNSRYIHIGGDEADISQWLECEKCLDAFRNKDRDIDVKLKSEKGRLELSHFMYASYIKHMSETVISCNRTPVVWEGFSQEMNYMIPKETIVISWECMYQLPDTIIQSGFKVLNMSWAPMYIVTPVHKWSIEEVYNWNIFRFEGINCNSPYKDNPKFIDPTDQIEGGQLLAWGDCIKSCFPTVKEGQIEEQKLIEERTPCLAENVWHKNKISDYKNFKKCYDYIIGLYLLFKNTK